MVIKQDHPTASLVLYADDVTLINSSDDNTRLTSETNTILSKISDWFASNKLSLNPNKTKYILTSTSRNNQETSLNFNITIKDHVIERVKEAKLLGVITHRTEMV